MQIYNKSVLIFALLFIGSVYSSRNYPYKCAEDLKLDTCYLEVDVNDSDSDVYVKPCSKGKICNNIDDYTEKIRYCYKRPELLDEGDKCKLGKECKSGICKSEKCSYLNDGEECSGEENCGLNSYCRSGKCFALAKLSDKCTDTEGEIQCKAGLVCGKVGTEATDKTCVKLYSVDDGTDVTSDEMCKSDNTDNSGKCAAKDDKATEWKAYVDAFAKELDDFLDIDDEKQTELNEITLGDKDIAKKYVEYVYKEEIGSGDDSDCVRDYYIRKVMSSNMLRLSFFSLIALAVLF